MWKPKPLLVVGLVVAGTFALVRWMGGGDDDSAGFSEPALVFDRIWIDQLPTKPKDTFHTFIAATQEPVGLFHAGSQWKGGYEVFAHTAGGDGLRIVYLQTNETEKVKARAWRCKEQGMDYCLELAGASRGVKRYRSMQGWEIGAAARPAQLVDRIASIARVAN